MDAFVATSFVVPARHVASMEGIMHLMRLWSHTSEKSIRASRNHIPQYYHTIILAPEK